MMKNVLVFPCGSEIGLEIYRSLRYSKEFNLVGASSVDDHGKFVYERYLSGVPFVDENNFIDSINQLIEDYSIDYIFPAHDSVVLKLAQNAEKINAVIVSSDVETCEIARSKKLSYEFLETTIKVPEVYNIDDEMKFPVFLKPDVGQGSKGTMKAASKKEIKDALDRDATLMILEYLTGDEYTVDCLSDAKGGLLYAQARKRHRTSNGISVNSFVVDNDEFMPIAEKINSVIKFKGVWFFQLKRDVNGVLTLLEIAPRVAGTMAVSRMNGVNLPLLSLYIAQDTNIEVIDNKLNVEIDRALANKYKLDMIFDSVYVDFDDAVIIGESVNYLLVGFLYKMMNEGKRIILITKHSKNIHDTLSKYRIEKKLFDEIIHLKPTDEKSLYIVGKAIFIDDSFSERLKVKRALNIPVFDVSEIVELV